MCDELAGMIRDYVRAVKHSEFMRGYRVGFGHGGKGLEYNQDDDVLHEAVHEAREAGEKMWKYLESIPAQEDIRKTLLRVMGMEA